MTQYIDKSVLVAEIEKRIQELRPTNTHKMQVGEKMDRDVLMWLNALTWVKKVIDTLETVNVGMDFNTFDDEFKAEAEKLGIDPDSELCKSIKDDLYATAIEYYKENRHEKN